MDGLGFVIDEIGAESIAIVTFTLVPEPGVALLLTGGLFPLLRRRTRQP